MKGLIHYFRPVLAFLTLFTILTGLLYPLVVTVAAQALFPYQANGSLIEREDIVIGSELIGQPFDNPAYFWGRPSLTQPVPYNGAASAGSAIAPSNPQLIAQITTRMALLKAVDPTNTQLIPIELVTASGSGLDPHISPAAAAYQVERVARARGLDVAVVRQLVEKHTAGRTFGLWGEPRVNVLRLNLELDALISPDS